MKPYKRPICIIIRYSQGDLKTNIIDDSLEKERSILEMFCAKFNCAPKKISITDETGKPEFYYMFDDGLGCSYHTRFWTVLQPTDVTKPR